MAAARGGSRRGARGSGAAHPWAFVVPAFAVLAVFFLTPTLYNFVYAFTDWSSFKSLIQPTGWSNFAQLASSDDLRRALVITLLYAGGVAVVQNLFGLGFALFLERDTAVNKVVRVVFFIPVIMLSICRRFYVRIRRGTGIGCKRPHGRRFDNWII